MELSTDLIDTNTAANRLHELLPQKTVKQWVQWLQNNRNQKRVVAYRLPFQRIAGGVFYQAEDLRDFADKENQQYLGNRRLSTRGMEIMNAFGINEPSGSSTGRKLEIGGINLQVDGATKAYFVQFITHEPLLVYRLEISQVRTIVNELQEALNFCDGIKAPNPGMRTVIIE